MSRATFVGTAERQAYRARRRAGKHAHFYAHPRPRDEYRRSLHPVVVTKRRFTRDGDGTWAFTTTVLNLGWH